MTSVPGSPAKVDVLVYGGTPGGLTAAAAKAEGMSVLVVEPSRWLGGMLGTGLQIRFDCPNPAAVGGLTRSKMFGFEKLTVRKRLLERGQILAWAGNGRGGADFP